jgi:hypothetical protein
MAWSFPVIGARAGNWLIFPVTNMRFFAMRQIVTRRCAEKNVPVPLVGLV